MKLTTSDILFLFGLVAQFISIKSFPKCPVGIVCDRYEMKWGSCDVSCGGPGIRIGRQYVKTRLDTAGLYRDRYCVDTVTESCNQGPCPDEVISQSGNNEGSCNGNTDCNEVEKENENCTYPDCPERSCEALPFINEIFPRQHTIEVEVMVPKGVDISPLFLYSYNAAFAGKPHPRDISKRGFIKSINGMDIYKVIVPCTFCGFNLKSGIALVDLEEKQNVVEFVSFGGSFSVTAGVVAREGAVSKDTGIILRDLSNSIQRVGSGCNGEDFTWVTDEATVGAVNKQQQIQY